MWATEYNQDFLRGLAKIIRFEKNRKKISLCSWMSCLCIRIFPNIWSLNHRYVWIKMSVIVSFDLSDSAAATWCRHMFLEIVPPPDLIVESGQSCSAWHHGSDWAYGPHLNSSCNEATLHRAMNKTPGPPLPWITSHCYYQVNRSMNKHEYPHHGLNTRHNSFAQFTNYLPSFPNDYFLHCHRDTYHMISEWLFVHKDITWDHAVLWQDVSAHVSHPLSFGYTHAPLSASKCFPALSLLEVNSQMHSALKIGLGNSFVIWLKMSDTGGRTFWWEGGGRKNIQNSKCCCLTTDDHTSKIDGDSNQQHMRLAMQKVFCVCATYIPPTD